MTEFYTQISKAAKQGNAIKNGKNNEWLVSFPDGSQSTVTITPDTHSKDLSDAVRWLITSALIADLSEDGLSFWFGHRGRLLGSVHKWVFFSDGFQLSGDAREDYLMTVLYVYVAYGCLPREREVTKNQEVRND